MKPLTLAPHEPDTRPPGASLRDPSYHDLCGFLATYPDAAIWNPSIGDWICLKDDPNPHLVVGVETATGANDGAIWVRLLNAPEPHPAADCIWLPTLDQLRVLLHYHFGTVGFFATPTRKTAYWYLGEISGMEIQQMTPLAEGATPEEAAIKALLMRMQR